MTFNEKNNQLRFDAVLEPMVEEFDRMFAYDLDSLPNFSGAGVYALYLLDPSNTPYEGIVSAEFPIYIGKAVPEGWRQGKIAKAETNKLKSRIKEHSRSIEAVGLGGWRFKVRFAILSEDGLDFISALESILIRKYRPLWNSYIDGFGNHDPGKGRYEQSASEWDTLHPGRVWASRLTGIPPRIDTIMNKINSYKNYEIS